MISDVYPPRSTPVHLGQTHRREPPGRERTRLEIHPVAALELQDLAGLVRGRDLEAEALDDLARLHDLLGVRFRELAGPDPERVLETDAHVAAHRGRHGGDRQLVAA